MAVYTRSLRQRLLLNAADSPNDESLILQACITWPATTVCTVIVCMPIVSYNDSSDGDGRQVMHEQDLMRASGVGVTSDFHDDDEPGNATDSRCHDAEQHYVRGCHSVADDV